MVSKIIETNIYRNSSATEEASASFVSVSRVNDQKTEISTSNLFNQSTKVTLSQEALRKLGLMTKTQQEQTTTTEPEVDGLTSEEKKEVTQLKASDSEVRAHELAHVMAGGSLVRKGASFQYEMGPNGIRYAIGGEVSIDMSPVEDDPSATITKMQQVKRAALAPAEPSAQDRSVAAVASQNEALARQELAQQTSEES